MKMNYQSGDKLHSSLGKRLSNRYLSSDAFTSSTGRFGRRTVSRLGSILKKGPAKRYYGVGQKFGLFEFKNIFLKILTIAIILIALAYTIPFTRYAIHRLVTKKFVIPDTTTLTSTEDILSDNEIYVAPKIFKTDIFVGRQNELNPIAVGSVVYDAETDFIIGNVSLADNTGLEIMLFSDAGYKGNFFAASESVVSTNSPTSISSTSSSVDEVVHKTNSEAITFEGLGYGQMLAKIPPQTKIETGTRISVSTVDGLKPVAVVSHVAPDAGSSFTLVYAQLLVSPTHIYKVKIVPTKNEEKI